MHIITFEEHKLIEQLAFEVDVLSDLDMEVLYEFLYELYDIQYDDDVYLVLEKNKEEIPIDGGDKVSGGIKGHFKKHWKKYAVGAGVTAAIGGGLYAKNRIGKARANNGKEFVDDSPFSRTLPGHTPVAKPEQTHVANGYDEFMELGDNNQYKQAIRYATLSKKLAHMLKVERDPDKRRKISDTFFKTIARSGEHGDAYSKSIKY